MTSPIIKVPGRLPSPPGVVIRVLALCRQEDTQIYDIADVIASDPALSARLLRFVNSPMIGQGRKTASLREAVILLGLRSTKLLALGFSLLSAEFQPRCPAFNLKGFWQDSFMRGTLARRLSIQFFDTDCEQAFMAGLLSGIGQLALAYVCPMEYSRVLRIADTGRPLLDVESEQLGVNHIRFGVHLLTDWQLPEVLIDAVAHQLESEQQDGDKQPIVQITELARQLTPLLLGDHEPDTEAFSAARRAVEKQLRCSRTTWNCFIQEVIKDYHEMAEIFDFQIEKQPSAIDLLSEARDEAIRIGMTVAIEQTQLTQDHDELLRVAVTDPLTGVANRARFNEKLQELITSIPRGLGQCALILYDLDHFKKINDEHGHQAGDLVIQRVSETVKHSLREIDMLARYGGEEFVILLPSTTPEGACTVAERIRKNVANLRIETNEKTIHVTISMGLVFTGDYSDIPTADQLIADADVQVYLSKNAGRNTWHYRSQPASKLNLSKRWRNLSSALTRIGRRH